MPSLRLGSVWNGHFWGLLQIGLYLSHSAKKCDTFVSVGRNFGSFLFGASDRQDVD